MRLFIKINFIYFFSAGVPDTPEIELSGDTIRWGAPDGNGRNIIMYRLFFNERSGYGEREGEEYNYPLSRSELGTFESRDPSLTEIDLTNLLTDYIQVEVEYEYSLVAINDIGPSNMSNTVTHLIEEEETCMLSIYS